MRRSGGCSLKTVLKCASLDNSRVFFATGVDEIASADNQGYIKRGTAGLLALLTVPWMALAESKFVYLSLSLVLTFAVTVAPARELNDSQLIYVYLTKNFPEAVEHAGGLSVSIALKELSCSFSNARRDGEVVMKVSCSAVDYDGRPLMSVGDTRNLIFGLINAGMALDRKSEPGTTYISVTHLLCDRLQYKSAAPDDCGDININYSCSAD